MKIWYLRFKLNDFENLWSSEKIDVKTQQTFDGRSQINDWKPVEAIRIHPNEARPLPNATYFYSLIPAFDTKAFDTLYPLIKNAAEILPIEFEGVRYETY